VAWTCPPCGHLNVEGLVCDACGVARRWHEDPPLELPRAPAWHELSAAWLGGMWGILTAAGALALAIPPLREAIGIDVTWIALEVVLAGAATWSSWQEAWFQKHFNQAQVTAPTSARTGQPFEVQLKLVPYERIDGLDLTVELVDRYYVDVERRGRKQVETRQRLVDRVVLERGARLGGRREHGYHATFDAPFPSTVHEHLGAQLIASVLGPIGFLVPGLGHYARNLREHGGFYVRATVRSGIFGRRFEQRVIVVHVGSSIAFG
jgi:hypothetical protein